LKSSQKKLSVVEAAAGPNENGLEEYKAAVRPKSIAIDELSKTNKLQL